MNKIKIAFVCTHNSCRSIMAEGWLKHLNNGKFEVYSAGTEVYPGPKPFALEVMEDIGIDMSHASSKLLDKIPSELDILITMGCGVECPYVPTKHREDWGLDDPSGGPKSGFEATRDIIKRKVIELIKRVENNAL
ncbi:arsenate reductase ArsC [Candidatus Izemoplasma sp. B36]|uniref:arsenate reductase ArsC n=1 Tax=Candidatus Izemoplasma sp. B36 TaxID=3242468 RepID=UPI003558C4FE